MGSKIPPRERERGALPGAAHVRAYAGSLVASCETRGGESSAVLDRVDE